MTAIVNSGNKQVAAEVLFDICVFCALAEEAEGFLKASGNLCDARFQQGFSKRNDREYRQTTVKNNLGELLRIHVSWPPSYGPVEASLHLKATLDEFQPRLAVMTGICAGDKRQVKLGDLVIPDRAFTYDSGKIVVGQDGRKEHMYDVDTGHPDQTLLQYARMFSGWTDIAATLKRPISRRQQRDWLLNRLLEIPSHCLDDLGMGEVNQFASNWRGIVADLQRCQTPLLTESRTLRDPMAIKELAWGEEEFPFKDPKAPERHVRAMGSGSAVRGDDPFSEVRLPVRKTVAIDMESAAFFRAAEDYPGLRSLLVKGVADYADDDKDDSFHAYAAVLSGLYALSFILEYANSQRMPRIAIRPSDQSFPVQSGRSSYGNSSYFVEVSNNLGDDLCVGNGSMHPIGILEIPDAETEVKSLIFNAMSSTTKKDTIKSLLRAKSLCHQVASEKTRCRLLVEITTRITEETVLPSRRHELWRECFKRCIQAIKNNNDPSIVELLASKVVDYVQDGHVTVMNSDANHLLSLVKKYIDTCFTGLPAEEQSLLLVRKSALLRNMSQFQATRLAEKGMSEESLRCAEKAVHVSPESWGAHLEQALSFWHLAQFERNHEHYNFRLEAAEDSFWDSITLRPTVYNLFSMARFFRLTYQAAPFLELFDLYARKEHDKREFLRNSFMLGEAAMQLWYVSHSSDITNLYLNEADTLLQKAINSECEEARHIVDLSFIKAAKGELAVGIDLISTLHSLEKSNAWTDIAKFVIDSDSDDDLVTRGFALGISDSAIWNKLGTFAITFLQDTMLAIQLYRTSLAINRSNAVTMTNLARALLMVGSDTALQEANMWISKAASCASRRFRWWKNVRDEIQEKVNPYQGRDIDVSPENIMMKLTKISNLHRSFQILKTIEDPDIRNGGLRKLIGRLLGTSLANSPKHSKPDMDPRHNSIVRVDSGFYFFEKQLYRMETVWRSEEIAPEVVDSFAKCLEYTRKGLLVSISGFSEEAKKRAYELRRDCQILLMDGDELETILHGSPSLEDAIRLKQLSFGKDLNLYHRIGPAQQLEMA